jgi:phage terminase small subunit
MSGKLTPRQERFVKEYLIDLNGTQAAIRAGYSARTAKEQAFDLLTRPHIREAVEKGRARISAKLDISQERVLAELAKIGFSDIRKVVTWRGLTTEVGEDEDGLPLTRTFNEVALKDSDKIEADTASTISEISQSKDGALKIKLHDKIAALGMIGKHLGMFTEKHEHSGEISFTFAEGDKNL